MFRDHLAAQQANANAQAQAMQSQQLAMQNMQNTSPWVSHTRVPGAISQPTAVKGPVNSSPALLTKVKSKTQQALDRLPMNLCAQIDRIEFWENMSAMPMHFTVVFNNGHTVSFDDVDAFPAEEHIARIALECP